MRVAAVLAGLLCLMPSVRAQTTLVADVRAAIDRKDAKAADDLVAAYRRTRGTTSEALEALSWLGRGALASGDNDRAVKYAQETHQLAVAMLATRALDSDKSLQVALGAAIETEAKAMVATGQRAGAILYLQQQRDRYKTTSIRGRLEKNINLLSLEGQPAPPLTATEHLGPPMPNTRGKPVLLFFWAHWCSDCKAEAPIIAALQTAYGSQGLVVIGPTRRYGYAAGGVDATPQVELAHIEEVRRQYYGMIPGMSVPVSNEDALAYGMDATPTLVLIDRQGKVALFHPGQMTRLELEPYIKTVVAAPAKP